MAVDLHTHSNRSDGTDAPAAVVRFAARVGLEAVALTDHDTLAGIVEARHAAADLGIELVAGVELSVGWPTGRMHMLGYFIEPGPGPIQDRLEALRQGRDERNVRIVEALQDLGHDIELAEVEQEAGTGGADTSVGRPHIAGVLVRKGVVATNAEAFDVLLAEGRPAYRPRPRLEAEEAAGLISRSGGVAVVAHPHTIAVSADDFASSFARFREIGVVGVECHYGEYENSMRTHLARAAQSMGLVATGGSDYHGAYKPRVAIGVGHGDLHVPDDALAALHQARDRG